MPELRREKLLKRYFPISWQGWLQAVSFWGVPLTGLPIDKFWIYLSVPVGALLMLFQYLLNLLTMALNWKGGGGDT